MNRSATMPTFFFGHGNPMNALQHNPVTTAWGLIGQTIARPRAILCISAHWYTSGIRVSPQDRPETIHDFGGFPRELYEVEYPAPGDPQLATRVRELLKPAAVIPDPQWGIDHGTWSVLRHVFPNADVPVVQLSLDRTLGAAEHFELGKRLAPLREEGVLLVGSGNVVHNLHAAVWGEHAAEPFDWALRFEQRVRETILTRDHEMLVEYASLGADALLSIPTPDHYLPLLYVLAVTRPEDRITIAASGIQNGSVSMLAVGYS